MSLNYKIPVAVLFLIFSVASTGSSQPQDKNLAENIFGDGALDEAASKIEDLLQLEWNGQNLALRRDWDERAEEKKRDEDALNAAAEEGAKLEKEIEQLVEKGVPEAQAARIAERRLGIANRFEELENVGSKGNGEFERAFYAISTTRSRGLSNSGGKRKLSFNNRSLSGQAVIEGDYMRFDFVEKQGQERSLEVRDDGQGLFKFQFTFDDTFIRLVQSNSGKTQLIWIAGDQVEVYVGDSFSEFMKQNPQAGDEMLFPLFKRFGIKTPVSVPTP